MVTGKGTQVTGLGPKPKVTYSNAVDYGFHMVRLRPNDRNSNQVSCQDMYEGHITRFSQGCWLGYQHFIIMIYRILI